jgi:hypothetical protein
MWDFIKKNWQVFEKWLQELSDGEAAFYVFILSLLVTGIGLFVRWVLRKLTKEAPPPPQTPKPEVPEPQTPTELAPVIIDKLPNNLLGEFIGRKAELALLTQNLCEADQATRIVQLIAPGGTGKTKLLRHWLNMHEKAWPNRIIWSFYSQGTTESKQVSLSPLISAVFAKFGIDPAAYPTEESKAEAFADLVIEHACLLVLDGLESLQHSVPGMLGQLKEGYLLRILKSLLHQDQARCIITTRLCVTELQDQYGAKVLAHDLQNLDLADAVSLLESHEVSGTPVQLKAAAKEYACHALALHLLGNVIRIRYQGDVQQRDKIQTLTTEANDPKHKHAYRVMQEYADWFQGQAELSLLYLLGLFDQPIEQSIIEKLNQANIPKLTDQQSQDDLLNSIESLSKQHHLLSKSHNEDGQALLDCHPLIREYFGQQLKQNYPKAYQQAHENLYEHYKAIPKQHQQALDEVYWPRIRREQEAYIVHKLGAFSDDLAVVAHFFDKPWDTPAAGLGQAEQAGVLNWAGFHLRALGRLREALQPMRAGMEMRIKQKEWRAAAIAASNLSELQLTLGDVIDAVQTGAQSVGYADESKDSFHRMSKRTTHADALHQAGQIDQAQALFEKAEQLLIERKTTWILLYANMGMNYCEILLQKGEIDQVLDRTSKTLVWMEELGQLLPIALEKLTIGRAYLQQHNWPQADDWLQQAVAGLREAGQQDDLPRGLLARAALFRQTENYAKAEKGLQEVYDIAEPSEMRLHMTDYHLESARLGLLADWDKACVQEHIDEADRLIRKTGYHRRDAELAELVQAIK